MVKQLSDLDYIPQIQIKGCRSIPGKWTASENKKYIHFLHQNKNKFETSELRRDYQVYKAMANLITTRSSEQCRGHHRKLLKIYKTVQQIVCKFEHREQRYKINANLNSKLNSNFNKQHEHSFQLDRDISVKIGSNKTKVNISVTFNIDLLYGW